MRVSQQPAYVLLNRAYSESSWIVEIIARDYGRLAVLSKGTRRPKSRLKGVLLPLQPLLLSWSGKGEVPTLTQAELDLNQKEGAEHVVQDDALVCGLYCNELLTKLIHRYDPHPELYQYYHQTIEQLAQKQTSDALHHVLRYFELAIIRYCGYGASFYHAADETSPIDPNTYYFYRHGVGFIACHENKRNAVSGSIILFLAQYQTAPLHGQVKKRVALNKQQNHQIKLLMRDIMQQIIGNKMIVSRDLFLPV